MFIELTNHYLGIICHLALWRSFLSVQWSRVIWRINALQHLDSIPRYQITLDNHCFSPSSFIPLKYYFAKEVPVMFLHSHLRLQYGRILQRFKTLVNPTEIYSWPSECQYFNISCRTNVLRLEMIQNPRRGGTLHTEHQKNKRTVSGGGIVYKPLLRFFQRVLVLFIKKGPKRFIHGMF